MKYELSTAGAANKDVARIAQQQWAESAAQQGIDLTGFDPEAPPERQISWARSLGLLIAALLSRFSSRMQHSTTAQVRECVIFAASQRMFVPTTFISIDEGITGRKVRRAGLIRTKDILSRGLVDVLLVFMVSRTFRNSYKGIQFFQECIVDDGLRAVSVGENIDTADSSMWKKQLMLQTMMDEFLLDSIASNVGSGLRNLAKQGFLVGSLPPGYKPQEVPGGRPTNLGRARMVPAVDPNFAMRIVQQFEWVRDGMPLAEAHRRWVNFETTTGFFAGNGPMKASTHRKIFDNRRYAGDWTFGTLTTKWNSKRDYARKVPQTDPNKIVRIHDEDLRIVSDELFAAVQARLAELKKGPRGPKKNRKPRLADLVLDCFFCEPCGVRFYQGGGLNRSMKCKNGTLCPCPATIQRDEAVRFVLEELNRLLLRDTDLIAATLCRVEELDAKGDEVLQADIVKVERQLASLDTRISNFVLAAAAINEESRKEWLASVVSAEAERAELRLQLAQLRAALGRETRITADDVQRVLTHFGQLLEDGAAGRLGDDLIYSAAKVFRDLVGGRVVVQVKSRPGRVRSAVTGLFVPQLLKCVRSELGHPPLMTDDIPSLVSVPLRKIPLKDQLAPRVAHMIDIEKHSFRSAAKIIQGEGYKMNSGVIYQIYARHYEMIGEPMPKRQYNGGHPRKRRSA